MNEWERAAYQSLLSGLTNEQLQRRLYQTKRAMKLADSENEMRSLRLAWIMIESELHKRK